MKARARVALHSHFVGVFIYADDVTLLALISTVLNVMLETCGSFAPCYDLQINSSPDVCIFLGPTKIDMMTFIL